MKNELQGFPHSTKMSRGAGPWRLAPLVVILALGSIETANAQGAAPGSGLDFVALQELSAELCVSVFSKEDGFNKQCGTNYTSRRIQYLKLARFLSATDSQLQTLDRTFKSDASRSYWKCDCNKTCMDGFADLSTEKIAEYAINLCEPLNRQFTKLVQACSAEGGNPESCLARSKKEIIPRVARAIE